VVEALGTAEVEDEEDGTHALRYEADPQGAVREALVSATAGELPDD
jgi:hypothetical protein